MEPANDYATSTGQCTTTYWEADLTPEEIQIRERTLARMAREEERLRAGVLRQEANLARQAETSRRIKAEKAFRSAQKVKAKEEFDKQFRPSGAVLPPVYDAPQPPPPMSVVTQVPRTVVIWSDGGDLFYDLPDNGRGERAKGIVFKPRPPRDFLPPMPVWNAEPVHGTFTHGPERLKFVRERNPEDSAPIANKRDKGFQSWIKQFPPPPK